ncbi:P-loop NTPase family protein [Lapidilactobacillus bayanensis]|uniref:hypothetical protein n=1 Tax=Lapidilactobacillus bayanensis TaxID=2485998 RepID=UPI000F778820|nr:hypothetical protein [Lapidilactobacillus bayanensis]
MKIMIIGSPGSGKSTYSRAIGQALNYPIFYLDQHWHQTDYSPAAKLNLNAQQNRFLEDHQDCIVDGNYSSTMPDRLQRADLIIWLQIPRIVAVMRVVQRSLGQKWFNKQRPDMAAAFSEHFNVEYWQFLKFVWDYPRRNYQLVQDYYQKYAPTKKLVILHNRREKATFLATLSASLSRPK